MISVTVRPNLERKPPDDCQRPLPRAASLTRMPICGRTPSFSAASRISPSSVYFSTTGMMLRPILSASIAVSMNSASLKPLQMMGVSLSAMRDHRQQLGLGAGLEAEPVRPAEVEHFLDDLPLLVDLDRIDAAVAALVLVLRDGRLEGGVNLAEAMSQDVGEADQHRQADAAQLQPIDQLLEVDGVGRILGRMDLRRGRRRSPRSSRAPSAPLRRARWRRARSTRGSRTCSRAAGVERPLVIVLMRAS